MHGAGRNPHPVKAAETRRKDSHQTMIYDNENGPVDIPWIAVLFLPMEMHGLKVRRIAGA